MKKENFIKKIFSCVIILELIMKILLLKVIEIENVYNTVDILNSKAYLSYLN